MTGTTTTEPGLEASLTELLATIGRTSDAMVAVDADLTIIGWNDSATRLLGYSAAQALGAPCHEILSWRNRCGDSVCSESCQSITPDRAQEIVPTDEVLGRSSSGQTLWLSASTIVPPPKMHEHCRLIHLIREISLPPELERLIVERVQGWTPTKPHPSTEPAPPTESPLSVLTPREREVLTLLTQGLDGATIAKELFLSPATVRNHIQHILTKLGVHSRAEAVALALRSS